MDENNTSNGESKELVVKQALAGVAELEVELVTGDLDDSTFVDDARSYVREVLHPLVAQVHASQDPVVDAAFRAHRVAVAARTALLAPFVEAEARIKKALGNRERALRAREESARKAIDVDDLSPTPLPTVVSLKERGITTRPCFTWALVDAAQVRREYLTVDDTKINKTVRHHGKNAESVVGGIQVTEETPRVTIRKK